MEREIEAQLPPPAPAANDREIPVLIGVAVIVAGFALQAGLNPPGGVLSKKSNDGDQEIPPGKSVLAVQNVVGYEYFYLWQSITLMTAIITIGCAVSGLPVNRRALVWVLRTGAWASLLSMLLLNASSISVFTPLDVYGREKITETNSPKLHFHSLRAHAESPTYNVVLQRGKGREREGRQLSIAAAPTTLTASSGRHLLDKRFN